MADVGLVRAWSEERVGEWLQEIGFGGYTEVFRLNRISGAALCGLTPEEIRIFGRMAMRGDRDELIARIESLTAEVGATTSARRGPGAEPGTSPQMPVSVVSVGPPTHEAQGHRSQQGASALPVDMLRDQILTQVRQHSVTLVIGATGTGKSIGIPQMLLDEGRKGIRILCTQPRRIAVTSLAKRVAQLRGTNLGEDVGYKIGGCSEVNRTGMTRLVYAVTAIGLLQCLRESGASPCPFTHLIIDEAHIRDAHIDFLLTLAATQLLQRNPHLKVVLMSAGLDVDSIRSFFARALGGVLPGIVDLGACRTHRLTERYIEDFSYFQNQGLTCSPGIGRPFLGSWKRNGEALDSEQTAELIADFILSLHATRPRRAYFESFLVFLPGKGEVLLVAEKLHEAGRDDIDVKTIVGGQTIEVQEESMRTASPVSKRSIILGTDVVESSVTIPDVDVVIDSCEHKRMRWDPLGRQSLLTLEPISRDEAQQRAGRAGRLRDGEVIRLIPRQCFTRLRPHAEPQILHDRLESVLLTLFEMPLIDPMEFLRRMPDPPQEDLVNATTVRLLELKALERIRDATSATSVRFTPTHFGQFLQRMQVDPEVGCLVMNGVRLGLVEECAVLAAVHQRGEPFLTGSSEFTPEQVSMLRNVRDVCSPGRGSGASEPLLPGDLMAGLRAFEAWRAQEARSGPARRLADDERWCTAHFLSLERLLEIEEVALQIRDVLTELGHSSGVSSAERDRMARRRRERVHLAERPMHSVGSAGWGAAQDLQRLLQPASLVKREQELLLTWCIAAAFVDKIVDMKSDSCMKVKYKPKGRRQREVARHLKSRFSVMDEQYLRFGDVVIRFSSPQQAHVALQEAALANSGRHFPWRSADEWGPRTQKVQQCRRWLQGPRLRIAGSSLAHPPPPDRVAIVMGDVLAMRERDGSSHLGLKCSVAPRGIFPLVLFATHPACVLSVEQGGLVWKLTAQFHGVEEQNSFLAPRPRIRTLLETVRNELDAEFLLPRVERGHAVELRRRAVLELMRSLEDVQEPMPPF
mmetsp:Transcript_3221/g.7584  ORF Transcript_3221/g.7584 Transcript_3221/m.7584 type:complete len:1033 (-) Transcript_3221:171-3269(-)|eukprot:CAMPEP_0170626008 /NCGR_PEP_ID=MMETSP0224-20130122/31100_1 /TAXON_ID=285029 /ORGANISM="Togula jolla, Strain CCCM 725" /LENGTH=1032 /DNA_ID=CAMNT_0010952695 /DNA_START=220 /DNA_END=3318 /DNA_ORIENTATION=+